MPKLILSIEDRIFLSAKELFYEKGYDQVNMKEISKKADIAVGTLYNYFSNKKELYISVLQNSWNITFEKLDELLEKDIDKKEKLKLSIELIYDEILDRKCMGIQVKKVKKLKENKSIKNIEKKIKNNIKKIFENIEVKKDFERDENILGKIVYFLLINLTMLIEYYPEERQENRDFLYIGILGFFQ